MSARYRVALAVGGLVTLVDQLTKRWAEASLIGKPVEIISGWLSFQYAQNTGSAFGFFPNAGPVIAVLGVGIVGLVLGMVRSASRDGEVIALGLILGGAAGNLVDRFTRGSGFADGYVVDFIRLGPIPNFNGADAAINAGIVLMFLLAIPWSRRA